jgi:hypothetical protein
MVEIHRLDPRVVSGGRAWVRSSLVPMLLFWVTSYLALIVLGIWLWESRGVISSELLFWEANRTLAVGVDPPNPAVVMLTYPPLILFLAILSGSAINAAALLGATSFTLLARLWYRSGAPWSWLLLLLLHPTLLVCALEYPSLLLRATLLLVVLYCDARYLFSESPQLLFGGAFALGALALVDSRLWPFWIYLTIALLIARRRPARESLSLLLVALLPVVFLTVTWSYLTWTQTGAASFQVQTLPSATGAGTWAQNGLWGALSPRLAVTSGVQQLEILLKTAPAYILLLVLFVGQNWRRVRQDDSLGSLSESGRGRLSTILLMSAPLADLLLNSVGGATHLSVLQVALPLLGIPLLWSTLRPNLAWRWAAGVLLLAGFMWSWVLALEPGTAVPQDLVRQAAVQEVRPAYREVADLLNAQLGPGQRVLMDEEQVEPLVALIHDSRALLLSHHPGFAVAQYLPEEWADYVVATDYQTRPPEEYSRLLAHFDLIYQNNGLCLFRKRVL